MNRRQFLLIFVCTGVHRKEVTIKEAGRLRGLYTILTKERGFRVQGTNCGEVTRKYMGETNGKQDCSSQVCLCKCISVSTLSL